MKPAVDLHGNTTLPDNPVVITTGCLAGLGDHSIFSTLPKRFKELGYTVLLDQDVEARNDDTLDLFWGRNPYIDDLTDKKPNAGYVRQGLFYEVANRYPFGSIEAMERAHGLPPPYSMAPYANYEPAGTPHKLAGCVLVDFSAVSSHIEDRAIVEFFAKMQEKYIGAQFVQVIFPKGVSLIPPRVANLPCVQANSVFEYLDMLHAARGWIGGEAGGQALAAVARGEHRVTDLGVKPEISVLITPKTFNSQGYRFAGADYRVTNFGRDRDADFWTPTEIATHNYEQRSRLSLAYMRALQASA